MEETTPALPAPGDWSGTVDIAWTIAVLSIISAVVLMFMFGRTEVSYVKTVTNWPVIIAGIVDIIMSLLFGLLFSMISSTYNAVARLHQALAQEKSVPREHQDGAGAA
jgi:uncharacterized membrane protein